MKRSGPPKRTAGLRSGGGLKADPEKTRAWQDRSRRPLASSGPIQRSTPIAGGRSAASQRPVTARAPIRKESARKAAERAARRALVGRLDVEGVRCEVCPEMALVAGVVVPGGCTGLGGIHERRKRSSVGTVEHAPNLIPCCNAANGWIENEPELAWVLFGPWLVLREGDAEWDACGRGEDPEPVTVKLCPVCGDAYVTVPPSGRLTCQHWL